MIQIIAAELAHFRLPIGASFRVVVAGIHHAVLPFRDTQLISLRPRNPYQSASIARALPSRRPAITNEFGPVHPTHICKHTHTSAEHNCRRAASLCPLPSPVINIPLFADCASAAGACGRAVPVRQTNLHIFSHVHHTVATRSPTSSLRRFGRSVGRSPTYL